MIKIIIVVILCIGLVFIFTGYDKEPLPKGHPALSGPSQVSNNSLNNPKTSTLETDGVAEDSTVYVTNAKEQLSK